MGSRMEPETNVQHAAEWFHGHHRDERGSEDQLIGDLDEQNDVSQSDAASAVGPSEQTSRSKMKQSTEHAREP